MARWRCGRSWILPRSIAGVARQRNLVGMHGSHRIMINDSRWLADEGVAADCTSVGDNDGVMFLEIDPARGSLAVAPAQWQDVRDAG